MSHFVLGAQVFPRTQGMALQLQKAAALVRDASQHQNVKTVAGGYHNALGLQMKKQGRCVPHLSGAMSQG